MEIRWLIRRDMESVLAIENDSFEYPWSEEDFLTMLRTRNCIGMVAMSPYKSEEEPGEVIGYMIYELHKGYIGMHNFAVSREHRREGVGTALIEKLTGKLSFERRTALTLEVQEENLTAQQFFRSQGFKATEVLYGHYEEPVKNAYAMRYDLKADTDTLPTYKGNRIKKFLPKEAGE